MLPATTTEEGAAQDGENPLYEMARVEGTSRTSVSEAIVHAVEEAAERGRDMTWFEVKELHGWVEGGTIQHHQVWSSLASWLHLAGASDGQQT